ncbi:hypothetical protein GGU10DRAFT_345291 [Lentinula aff. detonsa]|uniref:Uncharacterized protein n=1 Tax=Lentinula aff. detonsa TaxID=2804958 RepID=A0AA38NLF5_9AGAR|nr:hypothetical protein GGU10DRAFT_345291 [Lentinula aff. detonsa]
MEPPGKFTLPLWLSSCFACSIITIIWLLTRLSHSIWRPTGRLDHSMWFLLTFCQSSYILNLVSCDSLILYTLLQLRQPSISYLCSVTSSL